MALCNMYKCMFVCVSVCEPLSVDVLLLFFSVSFCLSFRMLVRCGRASVIYTPYWIVSMRHYLIFNCVF